MEICVALQSQLILSPRATDPYFLFAPMLGVVKELHQIITFRCAVYQCAMESRYNGHSTTLKKKKIKKMRLKKINQNFNKFNTCLKEHLVLHC